MNTNFLVEVDGPTFTLTVISGVRSEALRTLLNRSATSTSVVIGVYETVDEACQALEGYLNMEASK